MVNRHEIRRLYGCTMVDTLADGRYDAVILAVAHREFADLTAERLRRICKPASVIYDVKNILPRDAVDGSL
ncbi:MAG: hypothetical protein FWD79_04560 [Desulfobulbus sp.]|nr:hypothetical protein [Desulfobulbus sp.]